MLAAYSSFGYFPKGPPSEAEATTQRNGRAGVLDTMRRDYAGTGCGKMQCAQCWQRGVSATGCRCVAKYCRGHPAVARADGSGGPDFDATLLGKRVVVTALQNDKRAFAGVVKAFNAASGRHTVTLDGGSEEQHYLGYFPPSRMTVTGACPAAAGAPARC